ncbi:phosphatase PAP2 family protein [Chryseolinea lacunae]|uniref:Phosphatase PAP2 family protein n=1 Tax=Chryseolinea lacunae TaxID=2801331 RepID=A0ABS1KZB3_9BACT|nr:phosphatase PAP2 family protein [Chryseolinea lacunae]MBL0744724.1 phosphatase PAP2 family protein [Chryseolinea lacunae]
MSEKDKTHLTFTYRSFGLTLLALALLSIAMPPLEAVTWINGWHSPVADRFFTGLTQLGEGVLLVPVFVALLIFQKIYVALALAVNAGVQGVVVTLLKRFLFPMAKRPMAFLDANDVHFVPGVEVHTLYSFPSGHTVTIFGLCVFVALCMRQKYLTLVLVIVSLLVALSRVYLLQHFVTDVACGALVGTLAAAGSFHIFENMNKPQWMQGRLKDKVKSSGPKPKFS